MPSLYRDEVLDRISHLATPTAQIAELKQRQAQLLLARAEHLTPADARLMRLALKHRLSVREIAPLVNLNHGSVARRLQRLRQRLCDPLVVALLDPSFPLSGTDRQIGIAHVLRREPVHKLARDLGLSIIAVRRRIQYVRGWVLGRREGARVTRAVLAR